MVVKLKSETNTNIDQDNKRKEIVATNTFFVNFSVSVIFGICFKEKEIV